MKRSRHLKAFYEALAGSDAMFQSRVEREFFDKVHAGTFGWATGDKAVKAAAYQEAVDALEIYSSVSGSDFKRTAFGYVAQVRKKNLPRPSPTVTQQIQAMKRVRAQNNAIERKFRLLSYWLSVAQGEAEPEMPADGKHWKLPYFLNFDPLKVRPVLELLHADAAKILNKKSWDATLEKWYGVDASKNFTFDQTAIETAIEAEAIARIGAEVKGEISVEYKGFKLKASAEAFAGARAQAKGQLYGRSGPAFEYSAKGEVEVEVGIRIKADVSAEVGSVLDATVAVDAIAGALANAKAEATVSYQGVHFEVGAEVFAGARISGSAEGTFKISNRPVFSAKVEGSASAGVGAEAKAHFTCGLFGKVSMGAKAGVTVGLGASLGTAFSVDIHNLAWGAANAYWLMLNEAGYKNKGKVWFLPVQENVEMCKTVMDDMMRLLNTLNLQHEAHAAALQEWNLIEERISTAAIEKLYM